MRWCSFCLFSPLVKFQNTSYRYHGSLLFVCFVYHFVCYLVLSMLSVIAWCMQLFLNVQNTKALLSKTLQFQLHGPCFNRLIAGLSFAYLQEVLFQLLSNLPRLWLLVTSTWYERFLVSVRFDKSSIMSLLIVLLGIDLIHHTITSNSAPFLILWFDTVSLCYFHQ